MSGVFEIHHEVVIKDPWTPSEGRIGYKLFNFKNDKEISDNNFKKEKEVIKPIKDVPEEFNKK